MTTGHLQCSDCRHFHADKTPYQYTCAAFPDGIPDEIIYGDHDHREPFKGDHGIRFEAVGEDGDDLPEGVVE